MNDETRAAHLAQLARDLAAPPPARLGLREGLDACQTHLTELADTIGAQIEPLTEAFLDANVADARQHASVAGMVTDSCAALEDACLLLLARQSPVGGDLRKIVAIMRSIPSVQRGAMLLEHVAQSLTWVDPPSMPATLRDTLQELARHAATVYRGGVEATRKADGLAVVDLERIDDDVDLLHKQLLSQLYHGGQSIDASISLALIARYYERLADHGVELARQVAFAVTGERAPDDDR